MTEEQKGKAEAEMKTEVVAKAKRHQHSAEYKLRVLRELDECKGTGMAGALLRREGLYSSHLDTWRRQRTRGVHSVSGEIPGPRDGCLSKV